VAAEHAHSDAIGCVDETGTAKSGQHTTGVKRQPSEVQNLATFSLAFRKQSPQRYRIKDTHRGSEVWEIRHARRNAQASRSHRRTRRQRLAALGINPDKFNSVPLR
tara:strand:- start:190492 stop:190809 length:318 start_codon:yes stop_codon:yes gene_type:complete